MADNPLPVNGWVAYINARLLDPATGLDATGFVLTEDKKIIAVESDPFKNGLPDNLPNNLPEGTQIIDCEGKCLTPGLVDMRMQIGSSITSVGRAAVSGGITSMACLPNTNPVLDDEAVAEFLARRARKLGLAKLYAYGAVSKGLEGVQLAEIGMLADAGAVAFTDGIKTIADANLMRQALSYASTFDLMIVNHPELPDLAKDGVMHEGETSTRLGLVGIPRQAEVIMVERDLRLLELTEGRLHIAHISTRESVEAIRQAKARGLNVTCDTAPPYFALNEIAVGDYRTFAKLSPPLRPEADREAIIEGLIDGTIDAIGSDHAPRDEESKRLPFAQAAAGGVGLNTLLPLTLELYHNQNMGLLDALRLITSAPAELLKLPAGKLAVDEAADLVLFDLGQGWKVDDNTLYSRSKNSPFDGRLVQGVVQKTIVDGRIVFDRDTFNKEGPLWT